jgi:hypothetical protein
MLETKAVAAAVFLASALFAQWPAYPTPGVPKTSDGKANLSGPVPRTADGKPDLSGVWQYQRPPGTPAPAPAPANPSPTAEIVPLAVRLSQFWNLGAAFPDGLPFQPWAAELHRQRVASNSKDNPDAHVAARPDATSYPRPAPKMIQTPGVSSSSEANAGIQIFTDGRSQRRFGWFGYSTGKWDGDTLVVETTNLRDLGWLDVERHPSPRPAESWSVSAASITDIWKSDPLDDPKKHKPWTVTVHQRIMLDTDLIEFICQEENNKDTPHLR